MIRLNYRSVYGFVCFVFCILNLYATTVCFSAEPTAPLAEKLSNGPLSQLLKLANTHLDGVPACSIFCEPMQKTKAPLPFYLEGTSENRQYASQIFLKDQIKNGPYLQWYPNGNPKSETFYVNGEYHGIYREWFDNKQLKHIAHYKHGKLHGTEEIFTSNGVRTRMTNYCEGQLHGLHESYYPLDNIFGKVKALQASFENGVLHGGAFEYNEAGTLVKNTFYINGLKNGVASVYDNQGRIQLTLGFKHDQKHGMAYEYYPSGNIYRLVRFTNNKKQGEEKTFFENSQLAKLYVYHDDLLDGTCCEWSVEGVLIFEGDYVNGKRHGRFNKYDEQGNPYVLQIYENDQLVVKKKGENTL